MLVEFIREMHRAGNTVHVTFVVLSGLGISGLVLGVGSMLSVQDEDGRLWEDIRGCDVIRLSTETRQAVRL